MIFTKGLKRFLFSYSTQLKTHFLESLCTSFLNTRAKGRKREDQEWQRQRLIITCTQHDMSVIFNLTQSHYKEMVVKAWQTRVLHKLRQGRARTREHLVKHFYRDVYGDEKSPNLLLY